MDTVLKNCLVCNRVEYVFLYGAEFFRFILFNSSFKILFSTSEWYKALDQFKLETELHEMVCLKPFKEAYL